MTQPTNFELIRNLNTIAGNVATGDWADILKQIKIVALEYNETIDGIAARDVKELRDGIADILVTVYGLAARAGIDADADYRAVVKALYTRFDTNENDALRTRQQYFEWGVETYTHIDSQTVPGITYYVTKSAKEQTGLNKKGKEERYPAHKFLKSYKTESEVFSPLQESILARLEASAVETAGQPLGISARPEM